ncbi:MAG: exodeoxyribonuclease VII large subunit [Solirubrobacterales bacterium]
MSEPTPEPPEPAATLVSEPEYPGPFEVGNYARGLRSFLRGRPKVRLIGEVSGVSLRPKAVYFELRDGAGAIQVAIWRDVYDRLAIPEGLLRDGAQVVIAGGLDYYPGGAKASPSFRFRAEHLRLAGEGELLAQIERLRRKLGGEGLFELQAQLERPRLPRTLGVVTARDSAARADLVAGLGRRRWGGTLVFAHAPVQDRHAAPRITRALQDLAARPEIEAIVVCRGGGSLVDLMAFSDETLCRTVAMLRVPVIAAVGHQTDRSLIDDVAAVSCSTPTHAAEAAVPLDLARAHVQLRRDAQTLRGHGRAAVRRHSLELGVSARVLARHLRSERSRLHQMLREIRASSRRRIERESGFAQRGALVLSRKRRASLVGHRQLEARLRTFAATLDAHHPDRVLERGFALVEDGDEVITSAAAAREAGRFRVRFADDHLEAEAVDD